jgi:hypothetical protein
VGWPRFHRRTVTCGRGRFPAAGHQHARQVRGIARQQQGAAPCLELAGDLVVFLGDAHQVGHAQFLHADLLAQDFHLAFLQRDGTAHHRAGQLDRRKQFGMLLEEMRVVEQVVGNQAGIQFGGHRRGVCVGVPVREEGAPEISRDYPRYRTH